MMKKYLLSISLIFFAIGGFAQIKKETKILIQASPSLSMHRYSIAITIAPNRIEIAYEMADSIDRKEFKKFPFKNTWIRSIQLLGNENLSKSDTLFLDSAAVYYKKLDSAVNASTFYSRNNILLNKKECNYEELLEIIFKNNDEELNKKNERNVFDGTFFNIILQKNGMERKFQTHSPNQRSQPLFAKLIEQTIAFLPEKEQKKYSR